MMRKGVPTSTAISPTLKAPVVMKKLDLKLKSFPTITRHNVNEQRYYKVDGQNTLYPSVTTVLNILNKPNVVQWQQKLFSTSLKSALLSELTNENTEQFLKNADIKKKEEWLEKILKGATGVSDTQRNSAADFGTDAHILFDDVLKGKSPEVPKEYVHVIEGMRRFINESGIILHGDISELMVFSQKHQYAGALDAMGIKELDDGQKLLIALDWKTGKTIRAEYAIQVAAYAHAFEEMQGIKVDEAWVVRFDKAKPKYEIKRVGKLNDMFQVFLHALHLFRFRHDNPSTWAQDPPV